MRLLFNGIEKRKTTCNIIFIFRANYKLINCTIIPDGLYSPVTVIAGENEFSYKNNHGKQSIGVNHKMNDG